jgi:hypothetical protein
MSLLACFLAALGIVAAACEPTEPSTALAPIAADEVDDAGQPFDESGKLAVGVVAIGGETTGVTLTDGDKTWELELGSAELKKLAEKLDGRQVRVRGTLHVRPGVEVAERRIVEVESLEEAQ